MTGEKQQIELDLDEKEVVRSESEQVVLDPQGEKSMVVTPAEVKYIICILLWYICDHFSYQLGHIIP